MTISLTTFGNTPAAIYLARILADLNNPSLVRKIGAHITSTNSTVRGIVSAYYKEALSSKTAANCLRLLRREIVDSADLNENHTMLLVHQLTRNLRIGIIKRGIRVCTLARKSERVMANLQHRVHNISTEYGIHATTQVYKFNDKSSGLVHVAGYVTTIDHLPNTVFTNHNRFDMDTIQDITPEILMERSTRRLARRGLKFNKE